MWLPPASRLARRVLPGGVPVLRSAVLRGLRRTFGPPPLDLAADPGDPGLFGPDSPSWRVLADPSAIVGGLRALLVQLLHPLAMAGVADHSRFRADPLSRLERTSSYVTTVAFGSWRELVEVSLAVRGVHRRVRGTASDGQPYRADDPHLLAWVSVALTSSFLATDAAYAEEPVSGSAADRFVAEQSQAAALLDPRVDLAALAADADAVSALRAGDLRLPMLAEGTLPRTVAQLDAAIARYRPELRVDQHGREALRFLLWPPLPATIRLAYVPVAAGAMATVDADLRRLMRVPALGPVDLVSRAYTRLAVDAFRIVRGTSPVVDAAGQRARASSHGVDGGSERVRAPSCAHATEPAPGRTAARR